MVEVELLAVLVLVAVVLAQHALRDGLLGLAVLIGLLLLLVGVLAVTADLPEGVQNGGVGELVDEDDGLLVGDLGVLLP